MSAKIRITHERIQSACALVTAYQRARAVIQTPGYTKQMGDPFQILVGIQWPKSLLNGHTSAFTRLSRIPMYYLPGKGSSKRPLKRPVGVTVMFHVSTISTSNQVSSSIQICRNGGRQILKYRK